jgi:hypothetical protein
MSRSRNIFFAAFTALVIATMLIPASASAAQEWGSTNRWPWSGYWWPMLDTDTNLYDPGQALAKYDTYLFNTTGTAGTAAAWEKANHHTADAANDWWGHCHAWASASIMTKEPAYNFTKGGVTFNTNDTKGLVTELYYSPKFNWLAGTRNDGTSTTSDAYKDIAPAWMDYLLRYYVRYYRYPFIMDINADSQVWNFPVLAYTRDSVATANGENVTTTVWYSSPDYSATGTKYFSRTYTYSLVNGQLGTWTGASVSNHPDFAWVPTGKNPSTHVSEAKVEEILGGQDV